MCTENKINFIGHEILTRDLNKTVLGLGKKANTLQGFKSAIGGELPSCVKGFAVGMSNGDTLSKNL